MSLRATDDVFKGNRIVFAFALLVPLAGSRAEAGLVVSNLSNTLGQAWTIGRDDVDLTDSPVANRFATGSGPGWHLDSVVLNLGLFAGSPTGDIEIYLAADNGGLPGGLLTDFPSASPTSSLEITMLTPQTPIVLAPSTAYWLVASADVADQYIWNFTEDFSQTGLSGWLIGDTSWGGYPAGSWTPLILPPGATPAPTLFQVNASAVPEPSTTAMFGIGMALVGLGMFRRNRRGSRVREIWSPEQV
ncbi:choice-of-anchor R domain-containing protein [Novipirellula artificiosorum]|uniref:PEP-CTERM motif protein n=1 Tax=Novipirellula artificiosorum TaxID=2528016 RepID=A0A5C6CZW5_9BACT|nr:choice-of-anchor R domain-containing protein [Novipirellula artificiosorum]TWU29047.1 PEP-CTERM motif protein [Novipirellula artificiosorum]